MNVVIIEDEDLTAQRLISLLKKYDSTINVLFQIASVEEGISWFKTHTATSVDLIFMDIHLEDGDSFQIIKELKLNTPIIFTTAFDEYMIKAFKVNSIDYLLKPINYDELVSAIDKFVSLSATLGQWAGKYSNDSVSNIGHLLSSIEKNSISGYRDRFMITIGTKIRTVKTDDIAFFFLEDKTVFLTTFDNATFPVDYSLDKLMLSINPREFFRINRQFIVSLNAIQLVHTYSPGKLKIDLRPKPQQELFVSGDRISVFKEWLGK